MSDSANLLADRARDRIQAVAARQPEVVLLARYVSLAVRIDAPLVRAVRQELMPASDAGIEADLWFSPLVESVSSRGFVLHGRVAEQLRRELADEGNDNYQGVLNRVAAIVAHEHRAGPPALLVEERVIYLSLRKYDTDGAQRAGRREIEGLLRQAVKAMSEDGSRGLEMARWAQRALRGLPRAALETEAAFLLSLGASARLGGRAVPLDVDQHEQLPRNVSWILPTQQFTSRTAVHVTRTTDGVRFGDPSTLSVELSIPVTRPLVVELNWLIGPVRSVQAVSVGQGNRFVSIPEEATDIRVRTLSGEEFRVDSEALTVGGAVVDFSRICVGVVRYGATGQRSNILAGFLVGADLVATVTHGLMDLALSDKLLVRWQKLDIEATVVSMLPSAELMLLRLRNPIETPLVLPWQPSRSAGQPELVGALWEGVGFSGSEFVNVRGTVRSVIFTPEQAGWGGLSNGGLTYRGRFLELGRDDPVELPGTPPVAWSGAPIVSSGMLIGMLVAGAGDRTTFYAVPADELREGVEALLTGRENLRTVLISYGGRRKSDKDQAAAVETLEALRSIGLRPIFDTDVEDPSASGMSFDALLSVANSASVGAVLATPGSHDLPVGQRSLLLLQYRHWLDPRFGLLVFDSNRGYLDKNLVPANLIELDSTPREELINVVRGAYDAVQGSTSEESEEAALTRLSNRLVERLRNDGKLDEAQIQQTALAVPKGIIEINRVIADSPRESPWRSEVAQLAAMFSFAPQVHLPLREVRLGSSSIRAFALNAGGVSTAIALIDRGWLGRPAPHSFSIGISELDPKPSTAAIARALSEQIAPILKCELEVAQWLLRNATARFFIILFGNASRAIPLVQPLLAEFPGAILFFLLGPARPREDSPQLMHLPQLSPGEETAFLLAERAFLVDEVSSATTADSVASPRGTADGAPAAPAPSTASSRPRGASKRKKKTPKKKSPQKK